MPVKFIAEVLKGLFGLSETTSDESETETNITVERESGEGSVETSDGEGSVETGGVTTPDAGESTTTTEPDAVETEEGTAEVGETVEEAEADTAETESAAPVDEVTGIGPTYSERLADAGIETVVELAGADAADVAEAAEVSESRAADWITQAEDL
jgi:predicted flap endonuclease-1-like 5' DNA nuclease